MLPLHASTWLPCLALFSLQRLPSTVPSRASPLRLQQLIALAECIGHQESSTGKATSPTSHTVYHRSRCGGAVRGPWRTIRRVAVCWTTVLCAVRRFETQRNFSTRTGSIWSACLALKMAPKMSALLVRYHTISLPDSAMYYNSGCVCLSASILIPTPIHLILYFPISVVFNPRYLQANNRNGCMCELMGGSCVPVMWYKEGAEASSGHSFPPALVSHPYPQQHRLPF